jgi:hypothetical protein
MEWVREVAPLSAEAGMHRFVWDLHYTLPNSVHRSFYGPAGVWSLPGNYTVKLTANGKSSSQTLTVKMDPRISTAHDGLRQEFVAASRISARLGEVATAQERSEELQKQIAARKTEAAGNAEISAALAELARKIDEVHGVPGEEEFGFLALRLPGEESVTLQSVRAALTGLLMIVDGADAPPTADARTAAEKWEAAGAGAIGRWKAVEADLAAVNAALEKAKLAYGGSEQGRTPYGVALQLSGGSGWLCAAHSEDLICCSTWHDSFTKSFIAKTGCRFFCLQCALLPCAG